MPSPQDVRADGLPVDVLVTAMASRLADLQGTRIDPQSPIIIAPTSQHDAGRRAMVAGHMLACLESRLQQGESGFVPLGLVLAQLAETVPALDLDELRFYARFLDVDREIRYQELIDGICQDRITRGWSRLIRYQARLDRVKLTDAGQLWVRILRHREHWLFEDKEVEKIIAAIKGGLWEQIPLIATEVVTSIRLFNEHLTAIIESPSFRDLVRQYLDRRTHFSAMIERCHTAALQALELLRTDAVAAQHSDWARSAGEQTLPLSVLYEQSSRVHRATESLRRNWATLLDSVQQDKRPRVGVLRFDLALERFVTDPPPVGAIASMLNGLGGWGNDGEMLSVLDVEGSLPEAIEPDAPNGVEIDVGMTRAQERMQSWLFRNRSRILLALANGPKSLIDLLEDPLLAIGGISDVSALFGVYLVSDPLGLLHHVRVECRDGDFVRLDVDSHRLTVSNVVLSLATARRQS